MTCPHGPDCPLCVARRVAQALGQLRASSPASPDRLLSLAHAAELLGCSWDQVDALVKDGVFAPIDGPGRGRQVRQSDVQRYIDRLATEAEEARSPWLRRAG